MTNKMPVVGQRYRHREFPKLNEVTVNAIKEGQLFNTTHTVPFVHFERGQGPIRLDHFWDNFLDLDEELPEDKAEPNIILSATASREDNPKLFEQMDQFAPKYCPLGASWDFIINEKIKFNIVVTENGRAVCGKFYCDDKDAFELLKLNSITSLYTKDFRKPEKEESTIEKSLQLDLEKVKASEVEKESAYRVPGIPAIPMVINHSGESIYFNESELKCGERFALKQNESKPQVERALEEVKKYLQAFYLKFKGSKYQDDICYLSDIRFATEKLINSLEAEKDFQNKRVKAQADIILELRSKNKELDANLNQEMEQREFYRNKWLEADEGQESNVSKPEPKIDMKEECVEPVNIWKDVSELPKEGMTFIGKNDRGRIDLVKRDLDRRGSYCNSSSRSFMMGNLKSWINFEEFINSFEQMQKDIEELLKKCQK